jgi:hypothetical protein
MDVEVAAPGPELPEQEEDRPAPPRPGILRGVFRGGVGLAWRGLLASRRSLASASQRAARLFNFNAGRQLEEVRYAKFV